MALTGSFSQSPNELKPTELAKIKLPLDVSCESCKLTFKNKWWKKKHMEEKHPEMRKRCSSCSATFASQSGLWEHMKSVHENLKSACRKCGLKFRARSSRNEHELTGCGTRKQRISEKWRENLKKTPRVTTLPVSVESIVIDTSTPIAAEQTESLAQSQSSVESALIASATTFDSSEPIDTLPIDTKEIELSKSTDWTKQTDVTCQICQEVFINKWSKKLHIEQKHPDIRKKCSLCPSTFSSQSGLLEHLKSIHSNRLMACRFCGLSFRSRSRRNHHEAVECRTRPKENCQDEAEMAKVIDKNENSCSLCQIAFKSRGEKTLHMHEVHSTIRFKCDHCTLSFSRKSGLNEHIKIIHKGDWIPCRNCGVSFNNRSSRARHERNCRKIGTFDFQEDSQETDNNHLKIIVKNLETEDKEENDTRNI